MTPIYRSYNAGDLIYEATDQSDRVLLIRTGEVDFFRVKMPICNFNRRRDFWQIGQILKALALSR